MDCTQRTIQQHIARVKIECRFLWSFYPSFKVRISNDQEVKIKFVWVIICSEVIRWKQIALARCAFCAWARTQRSVAGQGLSGSTDRRLFDSPALPHETNNTKTGTMSCLVTLKCLAYITAAMLHYKGFTPGIGHAQTILYRPYNH